MYQLIKVQQPEPYDIVGETVLIAGVGTGFEGVLSARVRDGNGAELVSTSFSAGGTGILGSFQASLTLTGIPSTHNGFVEVYELGASGLGDELNKMIVPIVFGTFLLPGGYHGFALYTVVAGDTLSGIAANFYGAMGMWSRIFDANRNQIGDPNLIYPGQELRIPQ
jgi:nucleoid-associated protein YgaU